MTKTLDGALENTDGMYEYEYDMGPSSAPPNLREVMHEAAVEAITTWFFENFEDPVECTPYCSADGGYQYIWGGPYTADKVLDDAFDGEVDQHVICEAVEQIEKEGFEWVPSQSRMRTTVPMKLIESANESE
jgi:hypothetical protein